MNRYLFVLALISAGCSQKPDTRAEETTIRDLLLRQETAWNDGNIEEFMKGYSKSDSLMFIGANITRGWTGTLERYRKTYPDREAMGTLKFTFYEFRFISDDACMVTGKYHLKRTADEPSGMFTLLLRKVNGTWSIVYDHTS
ncbi:MAG TPA: nuclear transport factor 2 family protein [Cyclobacteriaceae bacterium]|nr:nuclear transport factor 2 family protein [Cyclobacteriaceae bacterium]